MLDFDICIIRGGVIQALVAYPPYVYAYTLPECYLKDEGADDRPHQVRLEGSMMFSSFRNKQNRASSSGLVKISAS